MAIQLKFKIEEAADALAFTFTDLTGIYHSVTNPTGWGAPNLDQASVAEASLLIRFQDNTEYEYPLDVSGGTLEHWTNGIEIFTHDIDFPSEKFTDGIYDFRLWVKDTFDDEYYSGSVVMGFCAVITGEVMKSSLSYKTSEKRTYKEWLLERMRLLDNLRYSADTGNLQHFQDNLTTLQRLK